MNLVRTARANRYAVYLITALLFAAGLWAVFQLPSNIYPEVNFPRIMILVHAGDLPPDSMLVSVTRPLEQAASEVQGVHRIRSKTIRGASEISVLFNPDADMQYSLQLLQGRVNESRNELPADADIQVERVSPTVFPVFSLILNGDVPGADLRDQAYYVLRPMISRVPGVGIIEVQATDTRQIEVIVDPQKMVAHRIALPDVADRLKATNEVTAVGRLQKNYLQYLVLTTGQFTTLDQIRNTVVDTQGGTPLHLSDIAEVRDGVEDRTIPSHRQRQARRADEYFAPNRRQHSSNWFADRERHKKSWRCHSENATSLRSSTISRNSYVTRSATCAMRFSSAHSWRYSSSTPSSRRPHHSHRRNFTASKCCRDILLRAKFLAARST